MIQALEANFQKHSEQQFSKFTAKLEEQVTRLDMRVDQLQSAASKSSGETGNTSHSADSIPLPRASSQSESREVNAILKIMRVKVARFDGVGVEDWIYKINKFFDLHCVSQATRLAMVAFHLEGAPSTWYQWMEKGGGLGDWESFLRALRLRFGSSIYDDPLGKIAKLVQTGRVSAFREEFEQLMTRTSGVPDQYFLNYFVWGLKTEIRRELLLSKPLDLADAMAKAQLYEDRNDDMVARARGDGYRASWPPRISQPYSAVTTSPTTPTIVGAQLHCSKAAQGAASFLGSDPIIVGDTSASLAPATIAAAPTHHKRYN
ncbi:hypothetical protein F8388_005667 [Cannabis sativa]|uniref:Retrotransposon gag domain-containing protein n=1 Tax=Cannabis sativa TaxID=3483 RepID=A0A7J6ENY9_CANSA|nr:hypothetical protein F8388_005667 [Cannabis sativa]